MSYKNFITNPAPIGSGERAFMERMTRGACVSDLMPQRRDCVWVRVGASKRPYVAKTDNISLRGAALAFSWEELEETK